MANKMPVIFVGHGNPMNAIEDNEFSRAWADVGKSLPHPQAILCVSAHWQTEGTKVTAMEKPKTIYDFYGFPRELYETGYPAPGSPDLAKRVRAVLKHTPTLLDMAWGLDHGTWSVLKRMFPRADVPVVQLSLDAAKEPPDHYELAKQLRELREEGVLILGSGNIVHNLGLIQWGDMAYDWATDFDTRVKQWVLDGDHEALVNYEKHGQAAKLSIPTNEHYLPLLYVLAMQEKAELVSFFAEKIWGGSVSMRSLRIG